MALCAAGVQAQAPQFSVVVTPNPYDLTGSLPTDIYVDATVTGPAAGPDMITQDSVAGGGPGVAILNDNLFNALSNGPIGGTTVFGPGGAYPYAIELGVPAGATSFEPNITVYDNNGDSNNPNNSLDATPGNTYGNFTVNVGGTATPEASTWALLTLGGIATLGRNLLPRRRPAN